METIVWDAVRWECPECDGPLEPSMEITETVVQCYECRTVFDVDFKARS